MIQVPVHTLSRQEDTILHDDKPCPKYDQLYQYYSEQSPEVREIYANYGHLFPYWAQMSGIKIYTLESIAFLHKKLLTDAEQDKPLVFCSFCPLFCLKLLKVYVFKFANLVYQIGQEMT